MVPAVPGIDADIPFKTDALISFRVYETPVQLLVIQTSEQPGPFGMQGFKGLQGEFGGRFSAVFELSPPFFIIGLDKGLIFGQGPFESYIAVGMTVNQVMEYLPDRPTSLPVRGAQLVLVKVFNKISELFGKSFQDLYPLINKNSAYLLGDLGPTYGILKFFN
jgi:hypothetical protein